ncbi:hypothetical protein [Planctomycetes bacterium K23_9]|uniref:hypothetical protein n=1 Tax=Stieleria marina TaxID=1930275 RepID=UPI0011A19F3E
MNETVKCDCSANTVCHKGTDGTKREESDGATHNAECGVDVWSANDTIEHGKYLRRRTVDVTEIA